VYAKINVKLFCAFTLIVKLLYFTSIMSITSKNIVVQLNRGEKLDVDNYKIWSMKVQYVLEEQEVLETLNAIINVPEVGNTVRHWWDLEACEA